MQEIHIQLHVVSHACKGKGSEIMFSLGMQWNYVGHCNNVYIKKDVSIQNILFFISYHYTETILKLDLHLVRRQI